MLIVNNNKVNFEHISHLCSSVSIVNFEHVIADWATSGKFDIHTWHFPLSSDIGGPTV